MAYWTSQGTKAFSGSDDNFWLQGSLDEWLSHAAQHSMDVQDGVLSSVLEAWFSALAWSCILDPAAG